MSTELMALIGKREKTLELLKKMFIENLHLNLQKDEMDPDAALFGSGLGLDSIDAVEIAAAIETQFKLEIKNFAKKDSFRTLNTLADMIIKAENCGRGDHE